MQNKNRTTPPTVHVSERNKNFEILRSMSMLFIVMLHYLKSVGSVLSFDIETKAGLFNYVASTLFFILFSTAVPCFVMITGFFLINKTEFNIKRIEKTWLRAFSIVLVIYVIAYLYDSDIQHIKDVLSIFYLGFREGVSLWFVDYYLGLIFVAPFLALLAQHLSKKEYQLLLLVLIFINITVFGRFGTALGVVNRGYSLQYFILLFFVGGYIRLYNPFPKPHYAFLGIIIFTVLQLLVQLIHSFAHEFGSFNQLNFVYSGLVFFVSVFLFIWVKNHRFNSTIWKPIVKVAPFTFAVYLFHDNLYIRHLLWFGFFQPKDYVNSFLFIPLMFVISIGVFFVGVLIDYVRAIIVDRIDEGKMLDMFNEKVLQVCSPLYNKLKSRIYE
ncbi:MAG: acyltransferase [Prevotella sp.]|nr:acyltransferase [Prevotella sp.]